MLDRSSRTAATSKKFLDLAKDKNRAFKLMGFGHRVYKNYDPRATHQERRATRSSSKLGINDPLLDIAKKLEEAALKDSTSSSASCTRTSTSTAASSTAPWAFPTNMFTVMFAIGRLPGWIAHWKEMQDDDRPHRPARPPGLHRPRGPAWR